MKIIQVTKRTLEIRKQYSNSPMAKRKTPPAHYSGDRPASAYFMQGWLDHRNESTTLLRRAWAEADEMKNSKPIIQDNELIVGQPDYSCYFEERERYNYLYDAFKMSPFISPDGRTDHTCLDYKKLLRLGVNGIIKEIEECRSKLSFDKSDNVAGNLEKEEFYKGALIELNALLEMANNYAVHARELAKSAKGNRKEELLQIAENLDIVPANPPKTLWQAIQSVHFYSFPLAGLYSAGRPDQYLLPFYEEDLKEARLTKEFAQELIDNFCLQYSTWVTPTSATGMMVGGTDRTGKNIENELTWMFITAVDHIRMPDPNLGLCITNETSNELISYSLDLLKNGNSHPALWNDKAVVEGLINYGFDTEDAHDYINCTCVEISIIGKSSMWTTCPYHNLAKILRDIVEKEIFDSYDELVNLFETRLRMCISEENYKVKLAQMERFRNGAESLRVSCLTYNCIERGKSISQGGAVYNAVLPNFVGFANIVDSLVAIDELVFKQKKVTLSEYRQALLNNWKNNEALRKIIINKVPHYGNNIERVDNVAREISDMIFRCCDSEVTYRGSRLIPGMFSYSYHALMGSRTPATPDGRFDGEPLADSVGPIQGRDTSSPTASILSATSWQQNKFLGGVAENIKFAKRQFSDDNKSILMSVVKTFIDRGGVELQLNSVDSNELEDALINPEKHGDLLVRIGGYSDFFVKISSELQKEILKRTQY